MNELDEIISDIQFCKRAMKAVHNKPYIKSQIHIILVDLEYEYTLRTYLNRDGN